MVILHADLLELAYDQGWRPRPGRDVIVEPDLSVAIGEVARGIRSLWLEAEEVEDQDTLRRAYNHVREAWRLLQGEDPAGG